MLIFRDTQTDRTFLLYIDDQQNNPSGDRPHDAQQLQRAQSPSPLCGHGHAHIWQVALNICFLV